LACSFYQPVPINGKLFLQACSFYRLGPYCGLSIKPACSFSRPVPSTSLFPLLAAICSLYRLFVLSHLSFSYLFLSIVTFLLPTGSLNRLVPSLGRFSTCLLLLALCPFYLAGLVLLPACSSYCLFHLLASSFDSPVPSTCMPSTGLFLLRPAPSACLLLLPACSFYLPALSACQFFLPACSFYRPVPINGMLFLQACPFYRLVAACPLNHLVPSLGLFLLPAFSLYWWPSVLCTASSFSLLSLFPICSFHLFILLSRSFYRPVPYTGLFLLSAGSSTCLLLLAVCPFCRPVPSLGCSSYTVPSIGSFLPSASSFTSTYYLPAFLTACSFHWPGPSTGLFLLAAFSLYWQPTVLCIASSFSLLSLLPICYFHRLFLLRACSFYCHVPSTDRFLTPACSFSRPVRLPVYSY
jgi:hypothetical protein